VATIVAVDPQGPPEQNWTPDSPEWWRERERGRLHARLPFVLEAKRYYDGDHPLQFATPEFNEAFGAQFAALSDNWCEIVVDAAVERMHIEGFRFGASAEDDEEAWEIWQRNGLDAMSVIAHTEMGKCGSAYLLVGEDEDGKAQITVEDPSQAIVETDPANRRKRLAGYKEWVGTDGRTYATLYRPDGIYKWVSEEPLTWRTDRARWVRRDDAEIRNDNRTGEVLLVPLENKPKLLGGGVSDLKTVIPLQNAVNKLISDMLVASEFAAFRQRYATGLEVPVDPVTNRPLSSVQGYKAAVSRFWAVADENVKFGEFSQTDLGNYVKAIEMIVQHVAAQTRTPPHYLLGQSGAFPSGESLKSTETGLVFRVKRKQTDTSEGHEDALRLAFKVEGKPQADEIKAETIWTDPESKDPAVGADAAVKRRSLGVPFEQLWADLGYSREQIKRMKALTGLPDEPPPGATTRDAAQPGLPAPTEPFSASPPGGGSNSEEES
jgi:hypothetical protein